MPTKSRRATKSTRKARATTKPARRGATKRATGTERRYGEAASKSVASAVRRAKNGTLKSGAGNHPKVRSRKQAIAIGLSEARKKGAKVPPPPPRTSSR